MILSSEVLIYETERVDRELSDAIDALNAAVDTLELQIRSQAERLAVLQARLDAQSE